MHRYTLVMAAAAVVSAGASAETLPARLELVGDAAASETLGWSCTLHAGRAYVAAAPDLTTLGAPPGSVRVFDLATGQQVNKLQKSGLVSGDHFGDEVKVWGPRCLVGAAGTDQQGASSGSAFLFDLTGASETLQLTAPESVANDHFGLSVAMDGQRILVGAALDDDSTLDEAGSAHLFDAAGGYTRKIASPEPLAGARFGRRVDLKGPLALVGASEFDEAGANAAGAAFLLNLETGQSIKLTSTTPSSLDQFGWALALGDGRAVVGSLFDEKDGVSSGVAYVFDSQTGALLHTLTPDGAVAGMQFGYTVAVSGEIALVGAPNDNRPGAAAGSAYLFHLGTGRQLAKLQAPQPATNDLFGRAVALDGLTALVTAIDRDANGADSGAAYVFDVPQAFVDGSPFGGVARAVPGRVQAEDFNTGGPGVAYHDLTPANQYAHYRPNDGVDLKPTSDGGASNHYVAAIGAGEWLKYTVNAASAGAYNLRVRYSGTASGAIKVEFAGRDGVTAASDVALPSTGSWSAWRDKVVRVNLVAGTQVMRVRVVTAGFNLNFYEFTQAAATTPSVAAVYREAEAATAMGLNWQTGIDTAASGGAYIEAKPGFNASSAPPGTSGVVSYTLPNLASGTYRVWGRVSCPTGSDDSFWVRFDNGSWTNWNNIPRSGPGSWRWDDVHGSSTSTAKTWGLSAGTHTLHVAYREDGARLDRLYVTKNGDAPQ